LAQTRRQADVAVAQAELSAGTGQSATVIHFTSRFFDLIRDGMRFESDEWRYQYWSLHASEFYFFHNGWLPRVMYESWMVELVNKCYRAQPQAWSWHRAFWNVTSSTHNPEVAGSNPVPATRTDPSRDHLGGRFRLFL
jgi:hypothetical protein